MPKRNVFGHIRASGQFVPNRAPPTHPPTHPGATHPPTHPPGRHPPGRHPPGHHPPTHPPTRAPGMFLGTFRLQPNLLRTAGTPKTIVFGQIPASAQICSAQPECQKRMFLGTFGLQANLVRTAGMPKRNVFGHLRASGQFGPNRAPPTHPPTHPGATHPPTHPTGRHPPGRHPPTHPPTRAPGKFLGTFRLQPNLVRTAGMPKMNLFGHIRVSAQFGPNSRNAKNESFLAHSGNSPIWSAQPECQKPNFLGTFGPQPNLVRTAGMPKRNVFGHIRASAHFGPNRAPPTHPPTHPPNRAPQMFLGTFRLQPNLVRTAGMPKTNLFGHIRASAQFGPNSRNAEKECFWAHSGFSPIWSEPGATHPPTHPPGRHPPGRHPPTHPPTHPGATNVFGHVPASAQFGPNSQNAKNHSFWAHSGFSPIWSEQPECRKGMFLGTLGLRANLVRTGRHPPTHPPTRAPPTHPPTHPGATHPPTHPPGRHECFWALSGFSPIWSEQPECQKRIFLGTFGLQPNLVRTAGMPKTNLFGHIWASAQLGPNSRNAENECFWAHSGFRPIWSKPGATHPPTHPPTRAPPTRAPPNHPPTHPPTRAPRMFLGTFGLQASLVRTAGMPKTNVFGHIPASGQFGPNRAPPTHPPTHPPTRAPPTQPPTHPPGRHECYWALSRLQPNLVRTAGKPKPNLFGHIRASAQFGPNSCNAKNESFLAHSGFSPIWSEQPECRKGMFLGTFGLLANLVQTGRHPPTHPPTRAPPTRAPPTRAPPTHPTTNPPGRHECFWARSGFSPIWSEQPECQKRIFSGTFGLQPNLVRTPGMPKTNLFGHIRALAQFGPNGRNAEKECFWAHSGFRPVCSEPGATHPPTHPPGRHPPTHPPTWAPPTRAPPTRAPPTHPPTHPGARNVFGHIPASAQFAPNSRNAKNDCFWADSGFGPICSAQPECQKRMFLGTFGLQANLVRTAGMPKRNVFGHLRASGQFGPNRAPPTHPPTHPGATPPTHPPNRAPPTRAPPTHPPTHPGARKVFGHIPASAQFGPNSRNAKNESFWAHSGFSPIWSEQPECQKRIFFGTFRQQPNLVRTAGMPKTKLFGHIRASAQFGPNSRNAEKECFWAHSGFRPIWSEPGATHPPTHPPRRQPHPPTHPPGRHPPGRPPPTHPPTRAPGMFLGTFRLQPYLVRTAGMPKRNVFGHIRASGQFGPNQAPPTHPPIHPGATHPPTHPPGRHPPGRHPPGRHPPGRHPPTHPPTRAPGMFLGTFRLQTKLVRAAGMPKTNVFGHIRASAQFGPNSRNAENECFWAHSGFRPVWSKQPERQKRIFLGTFRLRPNLVRTPGMPKRNLFGHIRASAQFGPNSRKAEKRMFLGTFGLEANLVRTAGTPKTNLCGHIQASAQFAPNSRNAEHECCWAHSGFSPIWSAQPECQKGIF